MAESLNSMNVDRHKSLLQEFLDQNLGHILTKKSRELLTILFTHRQGDPDALCSAAALAMLLPERFKDVDFKEICIVVPQGASTLASVVSSKLGIVFNNDLDAGKIADADLVIAVDLGHPSLLEPYLEPIRKATCPKLLVDHHGSNAPISGASVKERPALFDAVFVDPLATSTCEIVANGFSGMPFPKKVAEILMTGLMFDSQHLGIATEATLEAALRLVRSGASIADSRASLRTNPNRSEKLARIKASQRLRYVEIGEYIILEAEVSSFQASVSRLLLEIGGDVGIAYGEADKEARISIRCTQKFAKETGINLGEELDLLARRDHTQLVGGGHPTAASISGVARDTYEIVQRITSLIKEKLQ